MVYVRIWYVWYVWQIWLSLPPAVIGWPRVLFCSNSTSSMEAVTCLQCRRWRQNHDGLCQLCRLAVSILRLAEQNALRLALHGQRADLGSGESILTNFRQRLLSPRSCPSEASSSCVCSLHLRSSCAPPLLRRWCRDRSFPSFEAFFSLTL